MAEKRKPPDWTRTGTVEGYAEWLRGQSDAICVMVVRPQDAVLAIDERCKVDDAAALVTEYLPQLAERVGAARREKKKAVRLEFGANRA